MRAEIDQIIKESQALNGVGRAVETLVPLSVSSNLATLRQERLERDLLSVKAKLHAFRTYIKRGDLDFDPSEVVREFLASQVRSETV